MATQRRPRRPSAPRRAPLSTTTALIPVRSVDEDAWIEVQATIRKRHDRIRTLQADIRPLEEAMARFERNYRVQLGDLQDRLRGLRAEIHTFEQRTERIHTRLVSDPDGVMGELFTPDELREIGEFFQVEIPEAWFAGAGTDPEDPTAWDASGEGWHRVAGGESPTAPRRHGDRIRSLYRSLARRFHPDLCADADDRAFRHECMLRANAAWQSGDVDALEELADQTEHLAPDWSTWAWDRRLASSRRELERLTRQVARLRRRLKELRTSETFPLWSAGGLGESLIATRKRSLERDIRMAQDELEQTKDVFRTAMESWADSRATA